MVYLVCHTGYADNLRTSCQHKMCDIYLLLGVQWKTPADGQRNCPKHVEFCSKNKFEKLEHLVGFIKRIYHDARSPECQIITMHGHLNVKLSRCTVTWKSIYHDARSLERQIITLHGHLNVNLSRYTVTWTSNYHDARSPECQFITMHGHLNVKLSRCTVTWTSNYHDARSPERQIITMHGHLNVKVMRNIWIKIFAVTK